MSTKAKHPIAPIIRGAFLRALDIIEEKEGLTFSQLLHQEIEAHGLLTVLGVVGKFTERTSDVNLNHSGEGLASILSSISEAEVEPVRH